MCIRDRFCARIATGDYDAVIIGHSQFERIPVSRERQERLLQEQIWEIEDGISELKASRAERFTIKELERTKKNLEAKLQKLHDAARKDDVVTFEQLGVDRLYVDEAHSFKNLFLYTKMRNVAGLSTTDAQKSSDMLLKCRYIDEITHGKGVTFATGTPISNSMKMCIRDRSIPARSATPCQKAASASGSRSATSGKRPPANGPKTPDIRRPQGVYTPKTNKNRAPAQESLPLRGRCHFRGKQPMK